ncbi:hypothetical protein LTR20_003253 [Exophiala xenobiotica]|nr:hypothetical protein LTR20_003253 [Exophiala xenobiotica]
MTHYPITGIKVEDVNNVPNRVELQDWYLKATSGTNTEAALQLSLFIHALEQLQAAKFVPGADVKEEDAQLSYFRIAGRYLIFRMLSYIYSSSKGIHGAPVGPWDGATKDTERPFFCAHNQSTFPTWHRPYLVLHMLQFLDATAENQYKPTVPKSQWLAAAKKWRLPYWNYAARPLLPDIVTRSKITVITPQGSTKTFEHNPMASYQLKDSNGKVEKFGSLPKELQLGDYADESETFRFKYIDTINENLKGTNDRPMPHSENAGPGEAEGVIAENVSRLMNDTYFDTYATFASTRYAWDLSAKEWLSLEAVHNFIHGWVGGFMGRQAFAAFDPIFWHHHCFIDMIFDSWQTATGHKKWFDPKKPIIATNKGETKAQPFEFSTHPLKPFFKGASDKDVYTSDDTQWASQLGYKYDKTLPSTRSSAVANHSQAKMVLSRMVNTQLSMTRAETAEFLPANRKTDNDLIINVRYNRFGIHNGEAYWIHFFVGQVGAPENYLTNPDRVGSVYNFTSPIDVTGCENCQHEKTTGGLATGQVPITGAMLKDWQNIHIQEFPSDGPFDEHSIETYLAERLHWKIITSNGEEVAAESLPDLKVFVLLGDADHSQDVHVESVFGNYEALWGATAGKAGGGAPGDL